MPEAEWQDSSHDIPGENNDIIDVCKPNLDEAISVEASIYLFGSHFNNGQGIHNVNMNKGSSKPWERDDSIYQDGGFILQFPGHWKANFIGFASEAVHTKDDESHAGSPIPQVATKSGPMSCTQNVQEKNSQRQKSNTPVMMLFTVQ